MRGGGGRAGWGRVGQGGVDEKGDEKKSNSDGEKIEKNKTTTDEQFETRSGSSSNSTAGSTYQCNRVFHLLCTPFRLLLYIDVAFFLVRQLPDSPCRLRAGPDKGNPTVSLNHSIARAGHGVDAISSAYARCVP